MEETLFKEEDLQDFFEKKKSFAEIAGIPPEMLAYFAEMAYNLYEQGQYEDAKNIMDKVIMLEPNVPYSHSLMGAIYQKQEKFDKAIDCYSKAIGLNPEELPALVNRGELYLQSSRFDEAAKDLEKAIDLDPKGENPYALRARTLVLVTHDLLKEAEKLAKEKQK